MSEVSWQQQTVAANGGIGKPAWAFLLFWTALNLLQIQFTELTSDEGYYWFYARHLQWGYYDHPPLVALLIKAGTLFFPGEVGVRFFNAVLSTVGLYLFFRLLPASVPTGRKTFWVLLAAPLLHYLSFLVFPDGPLLFASLLFLFFYKRFLQRNDWLTAFWLGLSLALMAYAKYHGALVLLFAVMANPRLLRNARFYFSLAVAAALFAPHLWWQYQNGFPTFRYHFSGRTGEWGLRHVGEYLSQQIVAIGPALVFLPFVVKATDVFERTLKFIIVGTFLFFLFSSFKTFVHFHWTSVALFPLLYFGVKYYNDPSKQKRFTALVLPFAVLLFVLRLLLLLPFFPTLHAGEDYYRGRKAWAQEVKKLAGGRPVFLPNNLREASLYSFYSGGEGVTLYARPEKKSQYELWSYEDSLQGKEVLFLTKYPHAGSRKVSLLDRDYYYSVLPSFQSYYTPLEMKATVNKISSDTLWGTVALRNATGKEVSFETSAGTDSVKLVFSIEQNKAVRKTGAVLALRGSLLPGVSVVKSVAIPVNDLPQGAYELYFGIRSGVLPDAVLSNAVAFRR